MNEQLTEAMGFGEAVKAKRSGSCPICRVPINMSNFRDALSRKEFAISGMCQYCQDQVFSEPEE